MLESPLAPFPSGADSEGLATPLPSLIPFSHLYTTFFCLCYSYLALESCIDRTLLCSHCAACIRLNSQGPTCSSGTTRLYSPNWTQNHHQRGEQLLGTSLFLSRRNGARYGLRLREVLLSFGSVCKASNLSILLIYTLIIRT